VKTLDGPRIGARPGTATSLVILVHGYGANGQDLIGLGDVWRRGLPRAAFVSPDAPEEIPQQSFGGRQWFELTFRDPTEYWRGVAKAGPMLDGFIDQELARHGLDETRLAIVGFSQGTMMALHLAPRRARASAAVIGYSGMLAGPERLAAEVRSRPPILLVHGDADDVIPIEALHATREGLAAAGLANEWHVRPGLGHGIDEAGLELGAAFLKSLA